MSTAKKPKPKPLTKIQKLVLDTVKRGGRITKSWRSGIYRIMSSDADTVRVSGITFDILRGRDYIKQITDPDNSSQSAWVYAKPGENAKARRKAAKNRELNELARNIAEDIRIRNRNLRWTKAIIRALRCEGLLVPIDTQQRISAVFDAIVSETNTGNIPDSLSEVSVGLAVPPLPEPGQSDGGVD